MLNCWEFSARLFSCQLLVQFGDIVVPLCLVARSSYWGSQVVLLSEILDLELAATVPGAIGEDRLGAGQASWLFINQPHVPVEPWMTPRDKNLHSQELIGGWTMTCSFLALLQNFSVCLLSIHVKDMYSLTWALGRSRAHVVGHDAPSGHIITLHVDQ